VQAKEVLDELRTILVTRLKFDPRRAADITADMPLPKGVTGAVGLDSLDFIELSIALEERFGIVMDESQDLAPHFASLDTLCRYVARRLDDG
jgi:acyl carrier protein